VIIHRALFGSYERFIGIMLEHYGGELPLWLAPAQAIVLPVSDRFNEYAARVTGSLRGEGARVELDERSESVGRKIREAELRKIPYMLVVGEREQQEESVSVREHRAGDLGSMPLDAFGERLRGELYSAGLKPSKSSERRA
jgi:threonyl-tRNA synthetase